MAKADLETLTKTAKGLKIKVKKSDDEKSLLKKIREEWEEDDVSMDCLCPKCEEEIPDADSCPICGATFESDESEPEPKKKEKKKVDKPSKKEKGKAKGKEKTKGKEKKKKGKTSGKRGPRLGTFNYKDAVEAVASSAKRANFDVRERGNSTSYFLEKTKVFHFTKTTTDYTLVLCVSGFKPKKKDTYKEFSEEEVKKGHMATTVGILKLESLAEVKEAFKQLVELAEEAKEEKAEKKTKKKKEKKKEKKKDKGKKKKVAGKKKKKK